VLSLNDSVNYLLGDDDLVLALAGMRANLAENGLLVFDVNSRSTYVSGVSKVREVEHEGSRWVWRGRGEVARLSMKPRSQVIGWPNRSVTSSDSDPRARMASPPRGELAQVRSQEATQVRRAQGLRAELDALPEPAREAGGISSEADRRLELVLIEGKMSRLARAEAAIKVVSASIQALGHSTEIGKQLDLDRGLTLGR
jgi:hypothetical protein